MLRAATLEKVHGIGLILFAALIPVGEGAAFGALGLVALALVLRWRELRPRVLLEGAARPVHLGLLVWLAAGLLALVLSSQPWHKPSELGLWSPFLVIPLLVLSAPILDAKWFNRAALAFVALLAVASAYGILQFLLDARPGEDLFRFDKSRTGQIAIPGGQGGTVAGGFFFHRLKMAHVLLPGIGVLIARQLFAELRPRRRLVECALLALTGTAFLLTFTRGALVALGAAVAACVPFVSKRTRWVSAVVILIAIGVAASAPRIRERAVSMASSEAMRVRGFIWESGMMVVADHPLGAGLGNYPRVVPRYYDMSDPHFDVLTYPHSVVLAALAETGPIGAIAYIWAWAALATACLATLRRRAPRGLRTVAAAGLFGVVAFWAVGLTHDVLFHKPVSLAFSGMVGWVLATLDRERDAGAP